MDLHYALAYLRLQLELATGGDSSDLYAAFDAIETSIIDLQAQVAALQTQVNSLQTTVATPSAPSAPSTPSTPTSTSP